MYHIDPNINVALERQAERVRAVRTYGQTPPSAHDNRAYLAEALISGQPPALHRRWSQLVTGLVIFGLAVLAMLAVWGVGVGSALAAGG